MPVLAHRIGIDAEAEFNGLTADAVLDAGGPRRAVAAQRRLSPS